MHNYIFKLYSIVHAVYEMRNMPRQSICSGPISASFPEITISPLLFLSLHAYKEYNELFASYKIEIVVSIH